MNRRNAWDLTEEEFDSFPFPPVTGNRIGNWYSLNRRNIIGFKNTKWSPAGLAKSYEFWLNGKRTEGTMLSIRRLLLELPDDYNDWITYDLVKQYGQKSNQVI